MHQAEIDAIRKKAKQLAGAGVTSRCDALRRFSSHALHGVDTQFAVILAPPARHPSGARLIALKSLNKGLVNPELQGWNGPVKALATEWEVNSVTSELMALVPDDALAKIIWGCLKSDAIPWLHREVPMLGKQRPIDLLTGSGGCRRVKWFLLSSPSL